MKNIRETLGQVAFSTFESKAVEAGEVPITWDELSVEAKWLWVSVAEAVVAENEK